MQTTGHNWHVHENAPMENTACEPVIGGHYNPFSVSLGKTTSSVCVSADPYMMLFAVSPMWYSINSARTLQFSAWLLRVSKVDFLFLVLQVT